MFNAATLFSSVMLGVTIALFGAGHVLNPWDHYLSFGNESHIGLWGHGFDTRIVWFNNEEYGPYRGSIISTIDADGNVLDHEEWFVWWGVYYRYFRWSETKLWTLMVSLWYPLAVFSIIPAFRLLSYVYRRSDSKPS